MIENEADEMTAQQLKEKKAEVEVSKFAELSKWIALDALRLHKKSQATNLMDPSWVLQWKKNPEGMHQGAMVHKGFQGPSGRKP
eukprot:12078766-Prorocentrum_lima.AAC.1